MRDTGKRWSNAAADSGGPGAHAGVVFTEGGCALGLFHLDADFRLKPGAQDRESRRWLEGFDHAVELADACAATRVPVICEGEGDHWELLARGAASTTVGLLVRASRSTRRRVVTATGGLQDLWEHMADEPCIAHRSIDIAACAAPQKKPRGTPALPVVAVSVTEPAAPPDREPLDGMLLTTQGEAPETVARYERRWLIEEFFRVLKVTTRIEDRRLDEADDLGKCLAVDAITACRVMTIERLARKPGRHPGQPHRRSRRDHRRHPSQGLPPAQAPPEPTIEAFAVAPMAGFIPRKRQPLPRTETIRQGYRTLLNFVENHRPMRTMNMLKNHDPTVSG